MTFGVKRHLFGRFSWDSHFMIYMIYNVCKRASSRAILEGRSWRARTNSLKFPFWMNPIRGKYMEIHGNTWTLWLYCINPYPLKNWIWGRGVVLKFHFKIPFLQSCFLNDQYSSSFHVIGKQMKIKYLRLAPEEPSTYQTEAAHV